MSNLCYATSCLYMYRTCVQSLDRISVCDTVSPSDRLVTPSGSLRVKASQGESRPDKTRGRQGRQGRQGDNKRVGGR